jgi:hypothetical protein
MDLMPGNLLKIICHRFDLPLPVFRGSKGRIWMKSLLQHLRLLCKHTPLVSANAVIMWCMECASISYRMRLLDRARECMGGEGVYIYCTCISPFCSIPGSGYFSLILWLSVCMYVSVWCGGAPLSFSLDRRGDGGRMARQQRRLRGTWAILQLRRY